jgi:hypothetical protein
MLFVVFFALTVAVCVVPLAYAQEPTPPQPALQPIYEVFKAVGYALPVALLVGLLTCLLGYLKATPPEQFKLENFIYTALISLIVGVATLYGGWTYVQVEEWLGNGALTIYIYWVAKIIAKKLKWGQLAESKG